MVLLLLYTVTNLLWLAIYVLIIRAGFRDRTYGMPIVALCGNFCWEANYAFVRPYEPLLGVTCVTWLAFDCVILYTALRFGPAQFPYLSRRLFTCCLAGLLVMCWIGMDVLIQHFEQMGRENACNYTGIAQNVMISALFLAMLAQRRSLSGQSPAIAVCRLLAGVCAVSALVLAIDDGDVTEGPLLTFLLVSIVVLDTAYLIALLAVRRSLAPDAATERVVTRAI